MTTSEQASAVRLVLDRVAREPAAGLPYEGVPQLQAAFGSRRELLLALQRAWTHELWSRIETHVRRHDAPAADVTRRAWAECAECHPVLRRLLDRYGDELGPVPSAVVFR